MSATIDAERRELAFEARCAKARLRLQQLQSVLVGYANERPVSEVARQLGVSRKTVQVWQRWLGLRSGRQKGSGLRGAPRLYDGTQEQRL